MELGFYKKLQKDLEYLEKIDTSELSEEELIKIEATIAAIEGLEEQNVTSCINKGRLTNKQMLYLELGYLYENYPIIDYIEGSSREEIRKDEEVEDINLSEEEILEFNYNFFKSVLDEESLKILDDLYKNKRFLFHFNNEENSECPAFTMYFWYFNESNIILNRTHTIGDAANMAHEVGHTLEDSVNYNLSVFDDKHIFSEIVSCVCEILSLVFAIENDYYKDEALKEIRIRYNDFVLSSKLCKIEAEFLEKNANNIEKLTPRTIKRDTIEIMEKYGFLRDEIDRKSLMEPFITNKLHYNLGFLVAIEVAWAYINNKMEATEIIKKLLALDWNLPYEDFFKSICDIVELGANLERFSDFIYSTQIDKQYKL